MLFRERCTRINGSVSISGSTTQIVSSENDEDYYHQIMMPVKKGQYWYIEVQTLGGGYPDYKKAYKMPLGK